MLRAPCSQLNASNNQITYLDPLAKLKSLRVVVLNDNQIRVTVPLRGLKELSALVLSRNKIDGLDVREFGKLKKLSISHNQLRTCPKIAGCCKRQPRARGAGSWDGVIGAYPFRLHLLCRLPPSSKLPS